MRGALATRTRRLGLAVAAACAVLVCLVIWNSTWPRWTGLRGRTLWDLADLIVVPLSLAVIAYLLSDAQRAEDRTIAEHQREVDRELAQAKGNQVALQAYLSAMTDLLLSDRLDAEAVQSVARSRTLTVLASLDGVGKRDVMRFLKEAGMIDKESPVVRLTGADLSDGQFRGVDLSDAQLGGLDLSRSVLSGAGLRGSVLDGSILVGADFTQADLFGASFGYVSLGDGTTFDRAVLVNADFSQGYIPAATPAPAEAERRARVARDSWLSALSSASWRDAVFDFSTKWPDGFDASAAGASFMSD